MAILKTTALCTLALAAMVLPETADAHAFLLLPKVDIASPNKNLYAYTIPAGSVPPANAYNTGNAERNSEGFKKNYKAGNYKTLKEFIFKLQQPSGSYKDRPAGGTTECGFTNPNATPQPLPNQIEYGNYNLQNREGIHPGPCEAWCDDEIVIPFVEDCRTILFKGIPYDKSKCAGKSRFTFYWVATHFPPFQVYTSCAPIQGGAARAGTPAAGGATSTTPKAAGNATPKPAARGNNNNNDKVGREAEPMSASNSTANAAVKCKVRKN